MASPEPGADMRRRDFLGVLGGAAIWPAVARSQERVRRVGVLMNLGADDPEGQARLAAFLQGLQEAGWSVGKNLRVDLRWGAGDMDTIRKNAEEIANVAPDVILASTNQVMSFAQRATRTIPIVFAAVTDPVAGGFVVSLARPGRNATGFTPAEYGSTVKWLELLKDAVPRVTRVGVIYETTNPGALPQFAALQAVAPGLGVELIPIGLSSANDIKRDIAAFAQISNSGLIVTRTAEAIGHRALLIALAAQHKLPTVYPLRFFASEGGLIAHGPDIVDQHRRAAGYVDRILRGEKVGELPVQTPTKYELVINLKTARALGLTLPPALLARADEVIE